MTADPLAALYERHLAHTFRRPQTAISLATARFLAASVDARSRVLDMGSGLSSLVFRQSPAALVYTTDDDWKWLGTTIYELEIEGLRTDHMLHHDTFCRLPERLTVERFDLIFLDLGPTSLRVRELPRVLDWLARGGTLILDDWHTPHYTAEAEPILREAGFRAQPVPTTADEFGRYVAVAHRQT